jgi:N-acetylgalactosamine-6-sulfatase
MTGRYPARYSIHQHFASAASNENRGMPDWLDPDTILLSRLFKEAGYATGHFGKWHLSGGEISDSPSIREYAFDDYLVHTHREGVEPQDHYKATEAAVSFIRENKEKPLFINLWLHETHVAHYTTQASMDKFAHLDEKQQVYCGTVTDGDNKVGAIMDVLDELGLAGNTLLIFSSDNGPEDEGDESKKELRGGYGTYYSIGITAGRKGQKRSLFHGGTGTPFIARWPGRIPAGKVNDTNYITGVDLLPTFCQAAGIELPGGYEGDGESRLDVLMGKNTKRTKAIFWEWRGGGKPHAWPDFAVVNDDWKWIGDGETTELYKLSDDMNEENDLTNQYPEVAAELAAMWQKWKASLPTEPDPKCFSSER